MFFHLPRPSAGTHHLMDYSILLCRAHRKSLVVAFVVAECAAPLYAFASCFRYSPSVPAIDRAFDVLLVASPQYASAMWAVLADTWLARVILEMIRLINTRSL